MVFLLLLFERNIPITLAFDSVCVVIRIRSLCFYVPLVLTGSRFLRCGEVKTMLFVSVLRFVSLASYCDTASKHYALLISPFGCDTASKHYALLISPFVVTRRVSITLC
jgi:hypothetical protein